MLDLLEKMFEFSTNEKALAFIRKINVSAVQLIRACCPSKANDKFDPDKIYKNVLDYVKNLEF